MSTLSKNFPWTLVISPQSAFLSLTLKAHGPKNCTYLFLYSPFFFPCKLFPVCCYPHHRYLEIRGALRCLLRKQEKFVALWDSIRCTALRCMLITPSLRHTGNRDKKDLTDLFRYAGDETGALGFLIEVSVQLKLRAQTHSFCSFLERGRKESLHPSPTWRAWFGLETGCV